MINPITSAVDNLFIQYINFDYAKNIVELDGEYAFRIRTTKLNWTNNLHTDPLIKIKGYNIYRDSNWSDTLPMQNHYKECLSLS